jgi:LytS/YehU family sensor histidine kinase
MFTQTKALPGVLTFSEAKYYVFSAVFTTLAVGVPYLLHQFHLAGQIFLPMHFFVMFAGILFGWRTGLLVGVLSPLFSFSLTQMPVAALLPQVMMELAAYGLVAGFLREKKLNIWASLFSAMILGRLARILFIVFWAPGMDAWQFIELSWPGIILQIALIPITVYLLQKFVFEKRV